MNVHRGQGWTLLEGDCLEAMTKLRGGLADAVVCDPPYELGFMGKGWDSTGIAFRPETWALVLKMLKPGGHLLAFGGSRTFHRIACAIEDAGFEIRDTLSWLYGVGFPKSLNVVAAMEERGLICECSTAPQRDVRSLRGGNVSSSIDAPEEPGQVLLAGVSEPRASASGRAQSASDVRPDEPRLEGRSDSEAGERELQGRGLRAVPSGVSFDGAAGRVCDGAPTRDGPAVGAVPDADRSRSPSRPRPAQQRASEPGTLSRQRDAQTCGGCGKTRREFVEGRGTALKPAWEPVILARKPLAGTVASNIQAHGTGALNIDGCRIETDGRANKTPTGLRPTDGVAYGGKRTGNTTAPGVSTLGRWPANVLLDEHAAELLDAQTGTLTSGKVTKTYEATLETSVALGAKRRNLSPEGVYSDSGGASRFFYCAKSSRSERDAGCEALPARSAGEATDREDGTDGLSSPRAGAGRTGGARNIHPTVKPIALMRWLVRLVTPPGGTVLDPFTGSGSTGAAALQEGFTFIGCERETQYAEIAVHRLTHAAQGGKVEKKPAMSSPERIANATIGAAWMAIQRAAEQSPEIRPPRSHDLDDLARWCDERAAAGYPKHPQEKP